MPFSFCRTPCGHCYCSKIQKSSVSVSCAFVGSSHAFTVHLARSSPPLPTVWSTTRSLGLFLASVARWPALAGVFRGVGTSRGGRQGARTAAQRRSAPPSAPWLSAWPHARQRTPAAPSSWPDSPGRALCCQRTRAVPFRPKPALSF